MKLPALVSGANARHSLEPTPPGVAFDGRARDLSIGDLPANGRHSCLLVGVADGVEVTMPITIAATGEPPKPKRRRRTAAPKAAAAEKTAAKG